jgi:hypothetical protein
MGVKQSRFELRDPVVQLFSVGEYKAFTLHAGKVAIGTDQRTSSSATCTSAPV